MLHDGGSRIQPPTRAHGERGGVPAHVVRHVDVAPGLLHAHVARRTAMRALAVDEGQRAALCIDRERAHSPTRLPVERHRLVDSVQIPALRVERQKRGVLYAAGNPRSYQRAGRHVQAVDVNALTRPFVRVRAYVNPSFVNVLSLCHYTFLR